MPTWLGSMMNRKPKRQPYTTGGSLGPTKMTIVTADGAIVPMTPMGSDTIPTMMSPGEMAINPQTVQALGGPKGVQGAINNDLDDRGMKLTGNPSTIQQQPAALNCGTAGNMRRLGPQYRGIGDLGDIRQGINQNQQQFNDIVTPSQQIPKNNSGITIPGTKTTIPVPSFIPKTGGTLGGNTGTIPSATVQNAGIAPPLSVGTEAGTPPPLPTNGAPPPEEPVVPATPTADVNQTGIQQTPGYSQIEQLAGGNSLLDRTIANRAQQNLAGQQAASQDALRQDLMQSGARGPRAFGSLAMQGNIQGAQQANLAGDLAQGEQQRAQQANKDLYGMNVDYQNQQKIDIDKGFTDAAKFGTDAELTAAYEKKFGVKLTDPAQIQKIRDQFKEAGALSADAQLTANITKYATDPKNKDFAWDNNKAALIAAAPASITDPVAREAWAKKEFDVRWGNARTFDIDAGIDAFFNIKNDIPRDSDQGKLMEKWVRDNWVTNVEIDKETGEIKLKNGAVMPDSDPDTRQMFYSFDGNKIDAAGNVVSATGQVLGTAATYQVTRKDGSKVLNSEVQTAYEAYRNGGGNLDMDAWKTKSDYGKTVVDPNTPVAEASGWFSPTNMADNASAWDASGNATELGYGGGTYSTDSYKYTPFQQDLAIERAAAAGYSTKSAALESFWGTGIVKGSDGKRSASGGFLASILPGDVLTYYGSDGKKATVSEADIASGAIGPNDPRLLNAWLIAGCPDNLTDFNAFYHTTDIAGINSTTLGLLDGNDDKNVIVTNNTARTNILKALNDPQKSASALRVLSGQGAIGSSSELINGAKDMVTTLENSNRKAMFSNAFLTWFKGNDGKMIQIPILNPTTQTKELMWVIPDVNSSVDILRYYDVTTGTYKEIALRNKKREDNQAEINAYLGFDSFSFNPQV